MFTVDLDQTAISERGPHNSSAWNFLWEEISRTHKDQEGDFFIQRSVWRRAMLLWLIHNSVSAVFLSPTWCFPLWNSHFLLHIHTRRRASLRIFVILKRRITVWLRSFSPLFYVSLFLSAAEIVGDVDFAERKRERETLKIIFIRVQLSNLPFSPQKVRTCSLTPPLSGFI